MPVRSKTTFFSDSEDDDRIMRKPAYSTSYNIKSPASEVRKRNKIDDEDKDKHFSNIYSSNDTTELVQPFRAGGKQRKNDFPTEYTSDDTTELARRIRKRAEEKRRLSKDAENEFVQGSNNCSSDDTTELARRIRDGVKQNRTTVNDDCGNEGKQMSTNYSSDDTTELVRRIRERGQENRKTSTNGESELLHGPMDYSSDETTELARRIRGGGKDRVRVNDDHDDEIIQRSTHYSSNDTGELTKQITFGGKEEMKTKLDGISVTDISAITKSQSAVSKTISHTIATFLNPGNDNEGTVQSDIRRITLGASPAKTNTYPIDNDVESVCTLALTNAIQQYTSILNDNDETKLKDTNVAPNDAANNKVGKLSCNKIVFDNNPEAFHVENDSSQASVQNSENNKSEIDAADLNSDNDSSTNTALLIQRICHRQQSVNATSFPNNDGKIGLVTNNLALEENMDKRKCSISGIDVSCCNDDRITASKNFATTSSPNSPSHEFYFGDVDEDDVSVSFLKRKKKSRFTMIPMIKSSSPSFCENEELQNVKEEIGYVTKSTTEENSSANQAAGSEQNDTFVLPIQSSDDDDNSIMEENVAKANESCLNADVSTDQPISKDPSPTTSITTKNTSYQKETNSVHPMRNINPYCKNGKQQISAKRNKNANIGGSFAFSAVKAKGHTEPSPSSNNSMLRTSSNTTASAFKEDFANMSDKKLTQLAFFFNNDDYSANSKENHGTDHNTSEQIRMQTSFNHIDQETVEDRKAQNVIRNKSSVAEVSKSLIVRDGLRTPKPTFRVGHLADSRSHDLAPYFDPLYTQTLMSEQRLLSIHGQGSSGRQWEDIEDFSDDGNFLQSRHAKTLFGENEGCFALDDKHSTQRYQQDEDFEKSIYPYQLCQSMNDPVSSQMVSTSTNPPSHIEQHQMLLDPNDEHFRESTNAFQFNNIYTGNSMENVDQVLQQYKLTNSVENVFDRNFLNHQRNNGSDGISQYPNVSESLQPFAVSSSVARHFNNITQNHSLVESGQIVTSRQQQGSRRLRDASNNPSFVRGIVVRKQEKLTVQSRASSPPRNARIESASRSFKLPLRERNLFLSNEGDLNVAVATRMTNPIRNDLSGGSGVGVGSFQIVKQRKFQSTSILHDATSGTQNGSVLMPSNAHTAEDITAKKSNSRKGGRTAKRNKRFSRNGSSKRSGASKRSTSSGNFKRGGGTKNGFNSRYSRNRPGSSGTSTAASWAGNADDPNLQHVGGAEMMF